MKISFKKYVNFTLFNPNTSPWGGGSWNLHCLHTLQMQHIKFGED